MANENPVRKETLLQTSDRKTNILLIVFHDFTNF